jgi:hypothetical protein
MPRRPDRAKRGAVRGPSLELISSTADPTKGQQAEGTARLRRAEDFADLVAEVHRLIDAADVMALAALDDTSEWTADDALNHTLALHSKCRRLLNAVLVAEVG